jgi:prolipoprotein diacylglyceryltransferase
MEKFIIDTSHPGYYYIFFNVLTYAVGLLILVVYGKKIKLPLLPWLLTITSAFIFFVVGCKLIALHSADWTYLFQHLHLPRDPGRSLLGGLAFGIVGILIGRWYFKLPWKSLDAFAWVLPIGIAIHRVGCFAAGCCFGTGTELPWAVRYGSHTTAFEKTVHIHVHDIDILTSALHPVQLYESMLSILILPILWFLRKHFSNAGSFLGLSALLYLCTRLITEFFRHNVDPASFINTTQLILLAGIAIISLAIYLIEHNKQTITTTVTGYLNKNAGYFLLLNSVLFLIASFILLPFEILTIQFAFIPAFVILLIRTIKTFSLTRFRLASLLLPAVSFFMMGQAFPENSTQRDGAERIKKYHNIFTGYYGGQTELLYQSLDCAGDPIPGTEINYLNAFNIVGAGYEQTIVYPKSKNGIDQIKFGVQGFNGRQLDRVSGLIDDQRILNVYGFTPFVKLQSGNWEVGLGGTIGDFALINPFPEGSVTSLKRYWLYPMVSLRYGALDVWYGEIKVGDHFPAAFPGFNVQLATGFMDKNKRNGLRFGMASAAGLFINPQIYLNKNLSVDPTIGFLPSPFLNYQQQENFQFSFKLNYNFEAKANKD